MNAPQRAVEELLAEGEGHAHAGRFGQAEACAGSVLQRQPRNARAHYIMALAALFSQRPADALARIEQALRNDRVNAQYHFTAGACLAGLGRADEAVSAYRRALQFRPRFFEALANLGNVLENSGRHAQAAEAYRGALAMQPEQPLLLNGLGACELALGRPAQALPLLERSVQLRSDFPASLNNLSTALARNGRGDEALACLNRALELRPDYREALINLGEQLYMRRDDAGAIAAFDRLLAIDPANAEIRYLRDSIAGVKVERAPDEFVRNFFDRFARDFDERLQKDLGYRAPEALAQFLEPWLAPRQGLRIVDLGCGTGLSGLVVRQKAARLVGVDLSGEMLVRARERAIYDELAQMEIAAFLAAQPAASIDLALAADVFVYVGNLEDVFRTCAAALAPGGVFAFSVEHLEDGGEEFRLARTGRYAHAPAHLERNAGRTGLRLWRTQPVVLRHEDGLPVHGRLYAFEKPAA